MRMKHVLTCLCIAMALLGFMFSSKIANAANTPEEAQAMAEKAYTYYKTSGRDAAFRAFSTEATFHNGSLYVFVLDAKTGYMLSHGVSKALIGQDFMKIRDPEGKQFGKEILAVKDRGWVEYYWLNKIANNSIQKKRTYVINAGDVLICVGIYVEE